MPNHIHGIIQTTVGATLAVARELNPVAHNDENCDYFLENTNNNRAPARGAPTMADNIGDKNQLNHIRNYIRHNLKKIENGRCMGGCMPA